MWIVESLLLHSSQEKARQNHHQICLLFFKYLILNASHKSVSFTRVWMWKPNIQPSWYFSTLKSETMVFTLLVDILGHIKKALLVIFQIQSFVSQCIFLCITQIKLSLLLARTLQNDNNLLRLTFPLLPREWFPLDNSILIPHCLWLWVQVSFSAVSTCCWSSLTLIP